MAAIQIHNLQCESFIKFGRRCSAFSFSGKFSLFIRKMWTDQMDLDEWFETICVGPLELVTLNDCW